MDEKKIVFEREVFNSKYLPTFNIQKRYLILYGGSGSGKSHWTAQKLTIRMMQEPDHRFLLVRKVAKTIKESQFKLIKEIISEWKLNDLFDIKESTLEIRYIPNGSQFLVVGLDDVEKIKSYHRITGMWIEEATELMLNDLEQLNLRLRGHTKFYKQIILTYNPINKFHWLNKRFHEQLPANAFVLHSTYLDNKFIDQDYKDELQDLKSRDLNKYNIYCLGLWGLLEGIIYKPYIEISKLPKIQEYHDVFYGLDFGFNNPTGLLQIGEIDREYYLKELIYESGLTNENLIKKLNVLIPNKKASIYADASEPSKIQEIYDAGFKGIKPAIKGPDSVTTGIDYCKSQIFYTVKSNVNLNAEVGSYQYKKDKEGKSLEVPLKKDDHLMDGKRYAIYTHNLKVIASEQSSKLGLPIKRSLTGHRPGLLVKANHSFGRLGGKKW